MWLPMKPAPPVTTTFFPENESMTTPTVAERLAGRGEKRGDGSSVGPLGGHRHAGLFQ